MSNEVEIKQQESKLNNVGGESSWYSDILSIAITSGIVCAILFSALRLGFLSDYMQPSSSESNAPPVKVIVFTISDWSDEIPINASEELVSEIFSQARKASIAASKEGYIVLRPSAAVDFHDNARLLPGMFGSQTIEEIIASHKNSKTEPE